GKLIAWVGNRVAGNIQYRGGWFEQLYVGGSGPPSAPLFADVNGRVVVGQNGQVFVLDPYANTGAWPGAQRDASQNASGGGRGGAAHHRSGEQRVGALPVDDHRARILDGIRRGEHEYRRGAGSERLFSGDEDRRQHGRSPGIGVLRGVHRRRHRDQLADGE